MSKQASLLGALKKRLAEPGGRPIDPDEALILAALPEEHLLELLALAQLARLGALPQPRPVFACGIANAKSGRCRENCSFCAQSAHYRTAAPVYPLWEQSALAERASYLASIGASRFGVVTSGSSLSDQEFSELAESFRAMRAERSSPGLCASLGQLTKDRAERLRAAGVTRYHHNLETSAGFFPRICTTHAYDDDLATVRTAGQAGLETCCGGLFGLGETWADRVELSAQLAELAVDAIPINFLSPIPGTPLAGRNLLPPAEALRIIAIFRLMHPGRDIIICGGRPATLGTWQAWVFMAGANGLMTGNYLTTPGASPEDDRAMLQELGLRP